MRSKSKAPRKRVLLVAPQAPPYGGMALQAQLLKKSIELEDISVSLIASNPPFPGKLKFLGRLGGIRTLFRCTVFYVQLQRMLPRADVVHVLACSWLYFFLVVYPAVLISRLHGKRIVLNYHGGQAKEFFRRFCWLMRPVFGLADVVTAPSEFLAKLIRKQFRVSVEIVPNTLDFSLFRYRQRLSIQPKMLVTRHLEKIYDIESVLRAFRLVQQHYPEATLTIAGTGSEEMRLRRLASDWDLKGVRFLGDIANHNLPAIYEECDIFLNASLVDNFPGALLEASAAGLVVVSTCAGGIPCIYCDGKNALLVEPADWRGLANAVIKLLNSQSLAISLTRAALASVQACEWKQMRRALYNSYGFSFESQDQQAAAGREVMGSKCVAG